MKKVILIGCGNIGSRHLQALAKLKCALVVEIVEPNKKAQSLGKHRLNQIKYDLSKHKFIWHESITQLKNSSDLVIVATTSFNRINLIEGMLNLGHKRFLVEKIVCQSTAEYRKLLALMKKFHAKGWVNTNRRYFTTYRKLKDDLKNSKFVQMYIFSGNSGLGTNAIHHLDLFSWFIDDLKIKLDGKFLTKRLFTNKRGSNFKEFFGTLVGTSKNGSFISLTYFPSKRESFIINIQSEDKLVTIMELADQGYVNTSERKQNLKFQFEHTSSLTTKIANDIFTSDKCLLPTLEDSYYIHNELFTTFNRHVKKVSDTKPTLCPIT